MQIIGHEFTRRMLLGNPTGMPLYQGYFNGMPGQIETLRKRIADEKDPAAKAKLQTQLQVTENNYASQKELKPTPPNVTLSTQMTLFRGNREIQIRYLGRGHTAGDVVVLLPKERVVMTGDFLTSGLSNMSDSYPRGVGRVTRRAEEARLRHGAAGPRRGVHRQGQDRLLPGVSARRVGRDEPAEESRACRRKKRPSGWT